MGGDNGELYTGGFAVGLDEGIVGFANTRARVSPQDRIKERCSNTLLNS